METVKVDLPDGNAAELYAELKHKTQRAVEEMTRQYLTYPEGAGKLSITQGDDGEQAVKTKAGVKTLDVDIDLGRIDWNAVNESIILNQVASWTFGEVTAEVLGNQSEAVFLALKEKVDEIYQLPLAKSGGAS